MKQFLLLFFLLYVSYTFSQNGIIGTGFGSSDWENTDCFSGSAGSSRIFTAKANGTGNSYFRLVNCWGNGNDEWANWGPQNSGDKLLLYGTAYNSSDMIVNSSKAYYLNANSSYNYVFKTREAGNPPPNLGLVVFEVQGDIRTVSSVGHNPTHSPGTAYPVTATLSGSLSSGQGVYLRYTNDSWNTSSVVEMTGSTTSYSASVPADVNVAQASISYYVFTSGSGLTISAGDSDFYTINSNTNSGNNYSYVVDNTASIENPSMKNLVNLLYNTNEDLIYIDVGLELSNIYYQIMSVSGKIVDNGPLKNGLNTIGTESLSNGLYLIQLLNKSTNERIVKKLIKS